MTKINDLGAAFKRKKVGKDDYIIYNWNDNLNNYENFKLAMGHNLNIVRDVTIDQKILEESRRR